MLKIFRNMMAYAVGFWVTLPGFATLPQAPVITGAGDDGDFMKTGQGVFNEAAGIAITGIYVIGILSYCASLLWLLMQAKKNKEWGGFFKGAVVGLAVLVLVLILLTEANKIVTGQ